MQICSGASWEDFLLGILGIAMTHKKLTNKNWDCIEEKFEKKLRR
jgi:hypothetical protein